MVARFEVPPTGGGFVSEMVTVPTCASALAGINTWMDPLDVLKGPAAGDPLMFTCVSESSPVAWMVRFNPGDPAVTIWVEMDWIAGSGLSRFTVTKLEIPVGVTTA